MTSAGLSLFRFGTVAAGQASPFAMGFMIWWVWLSVGLMLLLAAAALTVAMIRAERRARRRLYRALGLGEDAVNLLMTRSTDVVTELSLLRMSPAGRDAAAPPVDSLSDDEVLPRTDPVPQRFQPTGRSQRGAEGRVSVPTRRMPYSGRHRRT